MGRIEGDFARGRIPRQGPSSLRVLPFFLLCGLLLLTQWGCQTPRIVRELERENRELENKIWELADLLEDKQAELEACRRSGGSSAPSPATGRTSAGPTEAAPAWPGRAEPPPLPAHDNLPGIQISPPLQETNPEQALPGSAPPAGAPGAFLPPDSSSVLPQFPETTQTQPSSGEAGKTAAVPVARRQGVIASGRVRQGSSEEVNTLVLHPQWVRGIDLDGRPGDDGIQVLFQPLDKDGDLLAAAAPVSVVVLDPQLSGLTARIARWDLHPDEVRSYFVQRGEASGFLLDLPWPAEPPVHHQLLVFVRYVTADGRRLEAQAELAVHPVTAASWNGSP